MKKLLAILMALCLLCSVCALAESKDQTITNGTNSATTELKVELGETYTVVIPTTLNIAPNATTTNLPIQVTALRLLTKGTAENTVRKLHVKIAQDQGYLENGAARLDYTMTNSQSADTPNSLYFTEVSTANFIINISEDNWKSAPAGTYSSTLTFSISIGNY